MHWDTYYELKDRRNGLYYSGTRVFLKVPDLELDVDVYEDWWRST